MTISEYIKIINKRYKTGISRDHVSQRKNLGFLQINKEQYFDNVPQKAWELTIGGYQPAEKWLKDQCNRALSMEEIQHYQKIIVALMETGRIMGEVLHFIDQSLESGRKVLVHCNQGMSRSQGIGFKGV